METESLVKNILNVCYEVHTELGIGFVEKVYENAMMIALEEAELEAQQQSVLKVYFRGQVVGEYFADIVVQSSVIIELKAVKELLPEHQAQLINYLNATKIKTGILVNFGRKGLEIKRAYSP